MKSARRLANYIGLWDQTIGCNRCHRAWWAENATDDMTKFHSETCPLYGRRDAAAYYINLPYAEKHEGFRFGIPMNQDQKRLLRLAHLEKKRRRARSGK